MRCPLVMGNWKLNGSKKMVIDLITSLQNELNDVIYCDVAIAPPAIYLDLAKYHLRDSCIALGAQNVDIHFSGPYTGEVSARMLKDIGVKYVIIGHSERRTYHQETNDYIAEKFVALKTVGLICILCVGESETERKAGQTEVVCAQQIDAVFNRFGRSSFEDIVVAYEPLWAIGSNKSATPLQAQTVHKFIRDHIANYDPKIAQQIIIQYGGSVSASNAAELFIQPDIDGALVGRAALRPDEFSIIVKAAANAKRF